MESAHRDDVRLLQVVDFHLDGAQMMHPRQLSPVILRAVESLEFLEQGKVAQMVCKYGLKCVLVVAIKPEIYSH